MIINKDASDIRSALTKFRIFHVYRCFDRARRPRSIGLTVSRQSRSGSLFSWIVSKSGAYIRQELETPSGTSSEVARTMRGCCRFHVLSSRVPPRSFALFLLLETRDVKGDKADVSRIRRREEGYKGPKKTVKDQRGSLILAALKGE